MKLSFASLFLLISISLNAQFGISAKYANNDLNTWNTISNEIFTESSDMYASSYEIGVDYWYRFKEKRVEFFPELSFSGFSSSSQQNNVFSFEDFDYSMKQYAFNLNTHIYFLDFEGDCDCPTWSKQGTLIDKGLFLLISPGYVLQSHNADISLNGDAVTTTSGSSSGFRLGLGLGLDIGINDFLTITPFAQYNYVPSVSSEFYNETLARNCETCDLVPLDSGSMSQIQVGLRIGFRPDYKGY